jgi:hypothetical protein
LAEYFPLPYDDDDDVDDDDDDDDDDVYLQNPKKGSVR